MCNVTGQLAQLGYRLHVAYTRQKQKTYIDRVFRCCHHLSMATAEDIVVQGPYEEIDNPQIDELQQDISRWSLLGSTVDDAPFQYDPIADLVRHIIWKMNALAVLQLFHDDSHGRDVSKLGDQTEHEHAIDIITKKEEREIRKNGSAMLPQTIDDYQNDLLCLYYHSN